MKIDQGSWSIDSGEWSHDFDDGLLTLVRDEEAGALQISAMRKPQGQVTHDELVEFAAEDVEAKANEVSCGDFSGVCVAYVEEDTFWRKWWLAKENLLLFVTYNCESHDADAHRSAVDDVLDTLEWNDPLDESQVLLADDEGNPLLVQPGDDGFVDLTFRIVDLQETATHYQFHLAASHKNQLVGFDVELVKGIQSFFDANMESLGNVYRKGVRFSRSGHDSDRLITAIGRLYMLKCNGKMVSEETFTAVALHQGELDFTQQPIKLKLFGRDSKEWHEDDYYESFFNVDLKNGFVYWNEKDPDYRVPLLRALSGAKRDISPPCS